MIDGRNARNYSAVLFIGNGPNEMMGTARPQQSIDNQKRIEE
jgi:hypothetical protein